MENNNNNYENLEIEKEVEEVVVPQKKELSQKQIEHLNNIRVKALEKKKEIKLNKMKEYQEKNQKQTVIQQEIKQEIKPEIKPDKPALSAAECKPEIKKKRVIKKVIRYVETDSDDNDDDEIVVKKRTDNNKIAPKVEEQKQVEKSYTDLIYESSLERMQSKLMNERAKHLITNIIPNYY
jgi:hypothetical protein